MRSRLLVAVTIALATTASAGPPKRARTPVESGWITGGRPARDRRAFDQRGDVGAWHASWDRDLGVPAELWGSHVDAPGATQDPALAEAAARAFLAANLSVLAPGAAVGDFQVVANQLDGSRRGGAATRTIGFAQTYRGLRVVDAQIGVVIAHDRIFALISTAIPNVRIAGDVAAPRSPLSRPLAAAFAPGAAVARADKPRVILPIVHVATALGADIEFHVADVVDVARTDAPGRWDVYLAPDGTPLARRATLYADGTGTIDYNAGERYAWGARYDVPAVTAYVTANGSATVTDGSGNVAWTGASPATVVTTPEGNGVTIVNVAGSATATATLTVPAGGAASWNVANVELDDAQVSTFVYGNIALARAREINPSIDDFLAGPIEFDVNEDGSCNGFSDGTLVYLYRAGDGCENTGRIADLTEHEFGHVFHNHSVITGVGSFTMDQGQAEGIADWNAANINNDSGVGRGLYFTNQPVRDIDPPGFERVYPTDLSSDPHISGEILSGALWDLRKTFIAQLGADAGVQLAQQIFAGVMQRSPDMLGAYTAALIADDDDGDLGDGTPDQCALEQAFGAHGLVAGYTPTAAGPTVLDGLNVAMPVTPGVSPSGCATRHVASIAVQWQVNGGFLTTFDLAASADGATWTGAFPAQSDGTVIHFAVMVQFDDGTAATWPYNPADPLYETFVGSARPIACWTMDADPTVADPAWTQTGVVGNEWQWAIPTQAGTQSGDPAAAHTGSDVLGTYVDTLFGGGYYSPSDQTSIATPLVDVSDYLEVHLQYWRWLTVEDGTYDQAQIAANGDLVWQNAMNASGLLDHVDREWRFQDVDVTPQVSAGGMQIEWILDSDATYELGGWNLDDVCLVGLSKLPLCGDGVLDPDEQCDDGNTKNGDGCSSDCQLEIHAGGGCAAGGDASGGGGVCVVVAAAALGVRRRRTRALT